MAASAYQGTRKRFWQIREFADLVIPDFTGIDRPRAIPNPGISKTPAPAVSSRNSAPVVLVRNLSFSYGDIPALNGVDLEIRAGEFVAIVGENGSGKTTLVKQFNNLLMPTQGDVISSEKIPVNAR